MAKSNMATVGHYENLTFLVLEGIYTCNTSNTTDFGVLYSFMVLFCPFGVILTLQGHGHGHLVTPTPLVKTWEFLTEETGVLPLIQLIPTIRINVWYCILDTKSSRP